MDKPPRGKSYPDSIRQAVVAQAREGRSVLALAREHNIGVKTITKWIREDKARTPGKTSTAYAPEGDDAIEALTLARRQPHQAVDRIFAKAVQAIIGGQR